MSQVKACGFGLVELQKQEITSIDGGMVLPKWLQDLIPGGIAIALWDWVNDHWDAIVEGFERGSEEGAELFF
ncbi:MAG: hypothetical protein AUK63_2013 [bacterium P3]|nr:MAG: hypothetical protein AUK63_2013 [bacterium P3]